MVILALAACTESDLPPALESAPLLARMSLDLTGRRPTERDLARVENATALFPYIIDDYTHDEGFGERLLVDYADVYRTRSDLFVVGADGDAAVHDILDAQAFLRSVGEEPLRLIQRIAADDLPYTTLVTADWTMANERLMAAWPLEAIEEGDGWVKARYTDTRPVAGILATNGLWWRYTTTIENVNRGRAQAVAEYLLCDQRFGQKVDFRSSTDVLDRAELQERTQTDPGCIGCHVVIDPLGSFLFGFYRNHPESYSEAAWYYPGREHKWETMTGIAPGFYGKPGESLYDLGQMIAADPALPNCAVEQGFKFMLGRAPDVADTDRVTAHREAFLGNDLKLSALYASLVMDPYYQSIDEDWEGTTPLKRMGPDMYASAVEALTGFRWTYGGLDMMTSDMYGLRVLAGGADGLIVSQPASDHATTTVLSQERLAEAAAEYAVTRETALDRSDRTLFKEVDPDESLSDGDVRGEVEKLVLRVHSRRVEEDDAEVDAFVDLWKDAEADGGPAHAWTLVLTAMLRHPDFVHY